jgi:hypothetical protein
MAATQKTPEELKMEHRANVDAMLASYEAELVRLASADTKKLDPGNLASVLTVLHLLREERVHLRS